MTLRAMLPPQEDILRIADKHIARYRGHLERAMAGIGRYVIGENQRLLDAWVSIRDKGGRWVALSQKERDEVLDALHDEEIHGVP